MLGAARQHGTALVPRPRCKAQPSVFRMMRVKAVAPATGQLTMLPELEAAADPATAVEPLPASAAASARKTAQPSATPRRAAPIDPDAE